MDIQENPFYVLGATARDNRRKIMDLAEEKSLIAEDHAGAQASSLLTNPRKRLAAELGWLPGLGPSRANELISLLNTNPVEIRKHTSLLPLARANILSAALTRVVELLTVEEFAHWVIDISESHSNIEPEATMMVLNEERAVAGFPELTDEHAFETELNGRRQHYKRAIMDGLDRMPTVKLVEAVTLTVDLSTNYGEKHAPILVDDLVDSFEVEAQDFLEQETGNINTLVGRIRNTLRTKKVTNQSLQ